MKKPSEIECLAAASESLICCSQYDADNRTLNFLRLDDLGTSESGVSLFAWVLADLRARASDIGVMLLTSLVVLLAFDFAGTESLLGGFAGLSLPERSRTPTLLLTDDGGLALKYTHPHQHQLLQSSGD